MNLFTDIKIFSAFGSVIKSLTFLILALKVIGWLFLAVKVVSLLMLAKDQPLDEVLKLN